MSIKQYTVLLDVIDRYTHKSLLPIKETIETLKPYETEFIFKDRIKTEYLNELYKQKQYTPHIRKLLNDKEWCIDCVIIEI